MCAPVFLGIAAGIGAAASIGTGVAGAVVSGRAATAQARAAQDAYEQNRRMELMLAQEELYEGRQELGRHAVEVRALLSRQAMSSRGIDMSSAYFDRLYDDTELFAMLDAEIIMENARKRAWIHEKRAEGFELQAEAAEQQIPYIRAGTAIGAAGAVLQGVPMLYGAIQQMGTPSRSTSGSPGASGSPGDNWSLRASAVPTGFKWQP